MHTKGGKMTIIILATLFFTFYFNMQPNNQINAEITAARKEGFAK